MKKLTIILMMLLALNATAQMRTLHEGRSGAVEYMYGTHDGEPYAMLSFRCQRFSSIVAMGYVVFDSKNDLNRFIEITEYLLDLDKEYSDIIQECNYTLSVIRISGGRIGINDTYNIAQTSLTFRQARKLIEELQKYSHLLQ
jgi:hypothetical protein